MICLDTIQIFKDLVLSGAAFTGAVVAVKGLNTWQRQLKGQSEYELSRRILVSVFKYRDAIDGVRNPIMRGYEMPLPTEVDGDNTTKEDVRYHGISKAYEARWKYVTDERASLYSDVLEAEAIWGNELKDIFKQVYKLEHELFVEIRNYLETQNPKVSQTKTEKNREILYDSLGEEDDEYKVEMLNTIRDIENYLKPKPKLRR